MPSYFFDLEIAGAITKDDCGLDLNGFEAARLEATRTLGDLARGLLLDGCSKSIALQVRDNTDQPVLKVTLAIEVNATTPD